MNIFNRLRNSKGMTITELMVAMGLTSIVGVSMFQVLTRTTDMQKKISEKLDLQIETALGDQIIVRDLRNSGSSLNNLVVKDDNNLNFFDFDPDRSSPFYRAQSKKSRTFTLKKGGKTFFYVMTFDTLRGKGLFADAVTFFQVGPAPANPHQPASLTYRGINYNNYLTAKDANNQDMNNPLLISTANLNKLVLVDSSSYMPVSPLKPAVFIGKVVKSGSIYDIEKIAATAIPKTAQNTPLWNYDIRTPVNTTIVPNNFEQFMYNLPPVGANGASVRIKPIRLFRYELDCTTDPKECVLSRKDVLHGVSSQKLPILRGFEKITFYREDIATSVFKVTVDKVASAK